MICHILPLCAGRVMNSAERPSSSCTLETGAWITCRHGDFGRPHVELDALRHGPDWGAPTAEDSEPA